MKKNSKDLDCGLQNTGKICDQFTSLFLRLKRSVLEVISKSNLSRWELAGQMSHLLDHEIPKWKVDNWTSQEKKDLPQLDEIAALTHITGSAEPLKIALEPLNYVALKVEDVVDDTYIEQFQKEVNARLIQKNVILQTYDHYRQLMQENQDITKEVQE